MEVAGELETSVWTPYSADLSMRGHRANGTHWTIHVERTFWRVQACSDVELAAWEQSTRAELMPVMEALLGAFEDASGAMRDGASTASGIIRNSDGSYPPMFPHTCELNAGDGVTVRRL